MSEPKHIAQILDQLGLSEVGTTVEEWGWNGARSARLSESGPDDEVSISRASQVTRPPTNEDDEKPQW